jgi:hypothetical protein
MIALAAAKTSVSAKAGPSIVIDQTMGWPAPDPACQKRAMKEAAVATNTTRKYCISATV